MKYLLTIILSGLLFSSIHAQKKAPVVDPNAPYLKDNKIPAFSITGMDGREITNKQLPKYKFTCIIIFSPDCPHCQKEAAEINKYAAKFKNVLFIWDSFRDMESIKNFAVDFNLMNKPNIIVGRDPNFTIASFYRPRMTPFMALYLNGSLLKVYEQGAEVLELAKIIESN